MLTTRKAHPQVERAVKLILLCIIDFVVKNEGKTTLEALDAHTGLKNIGTKWCADCLRLLVEEGILELNGTEVTGSVPDLTAILEQEKTVLPYNYGKPWSESDTALLCELHMAGNKDVIVAQKLDRTEGSVTLQLSAGRKAYRMIPWIERNSIIAECFSEQVSPNPER